MDVRQLGEEEVERPSPAVPVAPVAAAPPAVVPPARPATSRAKRALDLAVVLVTAPVVLVVGLITALVVLVTSGRPVLFAHERVGLGGRTFRMYKFRTMRPEAERLLQADPLLMQEYVENGYKLPAEVDQRITRVGRFLRRSSLDELPQWLNVLAGHMSVVGPRPVVPAEIENYGVHRDAYLSVRPGITGAWQVNGRSTLDYPERVAIDAEYVRSWSLRRDLAILLRTPVAVITARGAH
jgi:exopolysaccharide production protein ExoY